MAFYYPMAVILMETRNVVTPVEFDKLGTIITNKTTLLAKWNQ